MTNNPDGLSDARETIRDALMDSQYMAGVTAGWSAAQANDPEAALALLRKSREGHMAGYAEAKALLATPPASTSTAIAAGDVDDLRRGIAKHREWGRDWMPLRLTTIEALLAAAPKAASEDQAARDRRMYEQGRRDERAGEPEAFI